MAQNAIPEDITEITYEEFIEKRKDKIIQIFRRAYDMIKPE